ncbi:hypothetical protein HYW87_01655 [Candidatus Roizmanbacteria bacterium]|nr:hypothetical protein [Candidatus Roizmanbacteria bacterium]
MIRTYRKRKGYTARLKHIDLARINLFWSFVSLFVGRPINEPAVGVGG